MISWSKLFPEPLDAVAFGIWLLVFPVYHTIYPLLARRFPNQAAGERFHRLRRSWLKLIIEKREILMAVQQTRNLTMVSTLLASSALILLGFTANIAFAIYTSGLEKPMELLPKMFLLMIVLAAAFSFLVSSLRSLGLFNLTIGADPKVIDDEEGDALEFFATIIGRVTARYTMGVRTLFSALAIFLWCMNTRIFVVALVIFAVKFICFQDFGHVLRRPK